jgi:RNA polymerase sigma factor (TIGR02999 family)
MQQPAAENVTDLLIRWSSGDNSAFERLVPRVMPELRQLAASYMRGERTGHVLQTTALINEAWLRLAADHTRLYWVNSAHFFAAAAEAMRRILIDAARRRSSQRRGGHREKLELLDQDLAIQPADDQLLALDEALAKFETVDARSAEVVKLRIFAGMTIEDAARQLGISPRTAKREWSYARAWLRRAVNGDPGSD